MTKQCIVCGKELSITSIYCIRYCPTKLEPIPPQELGFSEYKYCKGISPSYSKYWTEQPLKVKND